MSIRSIVLILILLPLSTLAQSPEEDEIRFKSAMEWLESKLNYIYYDDAGEMWWNNTFYINDNKEITIKHIASEKPNTANIKNKTYTIRKFKIQDINPSSLKITEIEESRGRIVKGQMVELRTYGFQDLIHKTINNRRASSTSFLYLSFPESLVDSVSNYAEIVKSKLEEAILASTQIYASDYETGVAKIMEIMTGSFLSNEGNTWEAQVVKPNVLKLERLGDEIEYFGYEPNDKRFYLLSITTKGIKQEYFSLLRGNKLNLSNGSDSTAIQVNTPNSFIFKGETYFRQ